MDGTGPLLMSWPPGGRGGDLLCVDSGPPTEPVPAELPVGMFFFIVILQKYPKKEIVAGIVKLCKN